MLNMTEIIVAVRLAYLNSLHSENLNIPSLPQDSTLNIPMPENCLPILLSSRYKVGEFLKQSKSQWRIDRLRKRTSRKAHERNLKGITPLNALYTPLPGKIFLHHRDVNSGMN